MMVRRYNDEHLLFPTHQSSWQQQYFPGTDYTTFPAGSAASHSSSSESEFSAPETFAEVSNSPLRSPDTTTLEDGGVRGLPFLHLVEPPVESCRFRYPTEMKGTHGSILGISSLKKENARKRIFPTVKLCNYRPELPDEKVIIRCTITTADENEEHRLPHVHQLKGKGKTSQSQFRTVEIDDPIDIVVSPPNFLATFGNLTILFIKKENQLKVLLDKKKRHTEKMFTNIHQSRESILANTNEEQLLQEANNEIKAMTTNKLNIACLKFEALRGGNGRILYEPIPSCRPIFSNPIKNIKSAYFSDLRICRIDKVVGSCLGREEVFIFVDKVNKKDIRVRFFELNSDEEEVWYDYAEMGEDDVHFQYAIAFKTPKYKDVTITENVQVYFQLERPSNGSRSAPKEFEYTPDTKPWQALIRKRPRLSSPPIPVTVNELSHPSTSTSTTTWYPGEQSSRDAFLSPVSGLSSDKSSTNTMSSSDDGISDFDAIIRDLEDLEAFFPNIEPMEVEEQGTSILSQTHTSLNEALSLSSFPSGNSEMLSQMMRQDGALESWGSYNGVSSEVIQLLRDNLVTDGVCGSKKNLYVPMKRLTTVQKGLGSKILHNQNDKKLTRDNIVSTVDKVVDGLLKLKKNDRIQDKDMKRYLLGIFATGIEEDYDRVLHVLSAKEKEPTELSVFLNVLKTYDIAETVINLKNNNGQTTLHVAAEKGSLQTISLLVDLGADVNARDNNFNTPVHLVAKRSINDAFYALDHILEKNPDLWIHNEDGLTALHLFVLNRKTDIISSIIIKQEKENAPVDIINHGDRKRGNTPLHMAVQKRFKEIVLLLLNFDNRIDVNVKNFEDKTPLAFVYGENDLEAIEIAELLIENKADPSLVSVKKMLKEVKEFKELKHEDDVDMFEDIDDSLPSYALDWKSGAELKLLDTNTVCSVCPVLDENRNWEKLLKKLDFDEDMYHLLAHKWSPSLYLLKSVAEEMPHVTSEVLRDILIKLNSECKKAAQFIDDMILCKMGVF